MDKKLNVIVPLSTPLDEKGEFDVDGMERLVRYVVQKGVSGIFVLGSCGEFPCFDFEESCNIIRQTIKITNKKIPVYVGVGRCSTRETVKLAEAAKLHGADYIVVIPPYYFKDMPLQEIVKHYAVINSVGIPIVLYNLPLKARNLEVEALKEIVKLEGIKGLKYTGSEMAYINQTSKIIDTFQGDDFFIVDALENGAVGCVPGLANIFPELFVNLMSTYQKGDKEKARKLQNKVNVAYEVIYKTSVNAQVGVKIGLEALGICNSMMREPNGQARQEDKEKIKKFMETFSC